MVFRSDVAYIEAMEPAQVDTGAEELKRIVRLIDSTLPSLTGLYDKIEWDGSGRDLYDRKLKEAGSLLETTRAAFAKAGPALGDYVTAQKKAMKLVEEGLVAEKALGALIAPLAASQSWRFQHADPCVNGLTCARPPASGTGSPNLG